MYNSTFCLFTCKWNSEAGILLLTCSVSEVWRWPLQIHSYIICIQASIVDHHCSDRGSDPLSIYYDTPQQTVHTSATLSCPSLLINPWSACTLCVRASVCLCVCYMYHGFLKGDFPETAAFKSNKSQYASTASPRPVFAVLHTMKATQWSSCE